MAELSTLARPYAKAAFEFARDHKSLDQWSEQLAVAAAVAVDDSMVSVLDNPSLTADQQAKVVDEVCGEALDANMRNFIAILADNKRLPLLPQIQSHRTADLRDLLEAILADNGQRWQKLFAR